MDTGQVILVFTIKECNLYVCEWNIVKLCEFKIAIAIWLNKTKLLIYLSTPTKPYALSLLTTSGWFLRSGFQWNQKNTICCYHVTIDFGTQKLRLLVSLVHLWVTQFNIVVTSCQFLMESTSPGECLLDTIQSFWCVVTCLMRKKLRRKFPWRCVVSWTFPWIFGIWFTLLIRPTHLRTLQIQIHKKPKGDGVLLFAIDQIKDRCAFIFTQKKLNTVW